MKRKMRGLSLVELMVSLAIGSLLIVGAVFVYSQSHKTHTVNDTVARLQENARYALSVIEPDLQLAGYYGFTNSADSFVLMQGGSATAITAVNMREASGALAGLGATHGCRNNYAVDLPIAVEGSNNIYALGCAAQGGGALANADTLTIRRASVENAAAVNGRVQLLVSRLSTEQRLFVDGNLPGSPALDPGRVEVRNLLARTYYVSRSSDGQNGLPALRVKALAGGGPVIDDQEVIPGVEDLQVRFAVDTAEFNGVATRYVEPDAVPAGAQIVAVRIWLMMRADRPETGFVDDRTYDYADRLVTPNDGFRRVLVSRTIQLRNSRTL
jgi:type IV pilus assembly protein PilW